MCMFGEVHYSDTLKKSLSPTQVTTASANIQTPIPPASKAVAFNALLSCVTRHKHFKERRCHCSCALLYSPARSVNSSILLLRYQTMTSKYGVFTETQGIGLNDPYVDTVKPDPRDHGLNFKSPVCKAGKGNDATFDKYKPLYEGERFVEPLRAAIQQRNASRKKIVTDKAWKAASPMKESACPGDFVGTLGGKVPYLVGTVEVKKKKGEIQGTPKNIVTGPSKKGGWVCCLLLLHGAPYSPQAAWYTNMYKAISTCEPDRQAALHD